MRSIPCASAASSPPALMHMARARGAGAGAARVCGKPNGKQPREKSQRWDFCTTRIICVVPATHAVYAPQRRVHASRRARSAAGAQSSKMRCSVSAMERALPSVANDTTCRAHAASAHRTRRHTRWAHAQGACAVRERNASQRKRRLRALTRGLRCASAVKDVYALSCSSPEPTSATSTYARASLPRQRARQRVRHSRCALRSALLAALQRTTRARPRTPACPRRRRPSAAAS